jgi:spermidine/putrescine transport system ATP-binding protein
MGAPEEIYERPEKAFVAGFIGISNLLPGVVENGGVRLASGAMVATPVPAGCAQGEPVQLSVRPEKIAVDEVEDGMVVLDGTVEDRVYLGTFTQLIVSVGDGARLIALEQNWTRARAEDRWQPGDRVRLGWHAEHGHVLR